jgi:hypothetical protein
MRGVKRGALSRRPDPVEQHRAAETNKPKLCRARLTAPDFASLINPGWIAPPLDSSSSANVLSLED